MVEALGISGHAAFRDVALTFFALDAPLVDQGGGASTFTGNQQFRFAGGVVDYESNLVIGGRAGLPTNVLSSQDGTGTLEDVPGGRRLTLPFSLDRTIDADELQAGIPMQLDLLLSGVIVAYDFVVPEPGTGVLLGLGAMGLATRRARPRRPGGTLP